MKMWSVWLEGKPVLLNRLLSTHQKHQSRIKKNGVKGYFGTYFVQKSMLDAGVPIFRSPVYLMIVVYHRTKQVFDYDAGLKMLLDGIKTEPGFNSGIVDDNIKGIKGLFIQFKKADKDGIRVFFLKGAKNEVFRFFQASGG